MSRPSRVALAAALVALVAAPAGASPPAPAGLTVLDGPGWRADPRFRIAWTSAGGGGTDEPVAAHYRVRDPRGVTAERETVSATVDSVSVRATPGLSGVYTVEVWLEDAMGGLSPPATAQLRFDDARPGPVALQPPPEWIGRGAFPLRIRIGHPLGAAPLSGIRGYAVSLDASPAGSPCGSGDRCSEAETTLRGGVADDELTLGQLPEGLHHLHAVAVSGTGMKSASSGHAVLRVDATDPVTRLSGAPSGWTRGPVRLSARATDSGSGMVPRSGGPPPFAAIRVGAGAPVVALGDAVATEVVEEGARLVAYYARDAAGNVDDGARSNGVANHAPRTAWVRIDRTPPAAGFANSENPRDPELLRVRIDDPLSGPDPARGWIGVRRAGSGDPFERLPVAPPGAGELRARWSSDAYPRGLYEFRALAYDAAGNPAVTSRRRNGAPMVLSSPLKATTALRAGFRHGRLRRAAPYGRRIRVAGRLSTGRSTPLPGMPVRVVERFPPGARPPVRTSIARTGAGGRFSHRLGPGPTRAIEVGFAGTPTLARAAGPSLELRVRSRVRLRTSARAARVGGAPLLFRGRLLAAAARAAGRSVQLQFRLAGLPWAEFRTVKADRRGRFRYRYRFSDDDSRGARFQFRAFVPAQEGWPYEPGGSRPVLVRGL